MNTQSKTVYTLLKYTFGIVPIVAGLDKFTNLLTDWTHYLGENVQALLPFKPSTFMGIVGVVEIVAGILVLLKPKIGAYVVSGWLVAIALSLLIDFHYVDVAVRDLVMAVAAFSLAKLAETEA